MKNFKYYISALLLLIVMTGNFNSLYARGGERGGERGREQGGEWGGDRGRNNDQNHGVAAYSLGANRGENNANENSSPTVIYDQNPGYGQMPQ